MAWSGFPVPLSGFFADLGRLSVVFDLAEAVETSELTGGEILCASVGPRLWQGSVTVLPYRSAALERAAARLRRLQDPDASFLVMPPHMQRPGQPAATIGGIQNGRELRLNMTPGATVRAGEFLSFSYGSSPVRRALHQVLQDATAASGGLTPWVEVTPAIRPGATVGAAVELARPVCKAVIVPSSLSPAAFMAGRGNDLSFAWRQTLR
ncbi:hypothetical protein [Wenxinia saemankumensis]|uniref:Uncharacterized protein n=1 Tax=Wenxinia saemankumensis TaxID=1447782 RepID=A0A1M6F040_9RHOB|nr:hypothetical protein [Wenxinia saemankumensis]SHI91104.1 hypothetical protein SAMN05444417_2279 [Wenxinia saemankumensis]